MIDYQLIEADSPETLTFKVKMELGNGWEPLGGVTVVALGNDDYLYVQALIKKPSAYAW